MVLYLAHLIGDFPLQTNRIYELKSQSNRGILLHVAIHIMVAVILIKNPLPYWRLLLVLGIVHFIIDWTKLHLPGRRQTPGFILDQIAHFLSLILIASWHARCNGRFTALVVMAGHFAHPDASLVDALMGRGH